ncbi:MAG: MMPL family transporter [Desulfobacterium sp.]|nr:MMPL family transporter [Desulfobacterium sp.]
MIIPDKYKKVVPLVLILIFYLACLGLALGLTVDERITALLPDSDPEVADFSTFISTVPAAEALYIQITARQEDREEDKEKEQQEEKQNLELLERAGDAFYAAVKDLACFSDILYRFSPKGVMALMDLVGENRYQLLDKSDLNGLDARLTPGAIDARVLEIKRQLLSPSGAFSTRGVTRDPFGLDALILKRLAAFKAEMPGARTGESRIISKDGTSLLMVASPAFPAVETMKSRAMFDQLNRERTRLIQEFDHKIEIGFSGVHPATLDNSTTIQSDVKRAILVLAAGILVMGSLFFGRFYHVLLIFVPTMVSLTFASALAALFTQKVSAIALGCGALLVGITVDFGLHILLHADTLGTDHIRKIIRDLKKPITMGAATTMAAFGSLMLSSLPGQRQMGLFAVTGIFVAALFSFVFLRYFIVIVPWRPTPPRLSPVGFSNGLMAFRKKHMILLWVLVLALLAAGLGGLTRFTFEGDAAAMNHLTPDVKRDMDNFLETWGQATPTIFMVKGRDVDHALELNDELLRVLKGMEAENIIAGTASLGEIFPSRAEEELRFQAVKSFFTPQRTAALKTSLEQASVRHGFALDAFSPFVDELESLAATSPQPMSLEDFKPTVIYPLIKGKLIKLKSGNSNQEGHSPDLANGKKQDRAAVLTTARIMDRDRIPEITARIKSAVPGTLIVDKPYFVERTTILVAGEFKRFFLWAAFSMILVLLLFQRRLKLVAVTITPVCLSSVVTAGLLGLLGIPMNLISIVFIIFVFGVGVDFSIFMVHHELNTPKDDRQITPAGVILCAMTTIAAFISLCFARHNALFSIGAAGTTGMAVTLFFTMVMIPFLCEHWLSDEGIKP